ncbi:hypothetical protein [Mariniradius saccharolyticus]|uniref:hypothetical protein n=1 Tax=Mariniradius saccharolyticus TaxID=1245591 RepID=UPI00058DBDD5|nr:hypothetical protein [Mariniradius saccharolyticus]
MRKVIAIYQIFSGVVGALMAVGSIIDLFQGFNLKAFSFLAVMLSISIFLVYCGLRLFLFQSSQIFKLNFLSQAIQIVSFSVGGFHFMFFFGLPVYCSLESSEGVELKFGAGLSKFAISTGADPDFFSISINLVAVVLALWFWEKWKQEEV